MGCCDNGPQTEWLKQQDIFPHGSGGWESKLKVLAELISSERHSPGWLMDVFFHSLHRVFCVRVCPNSSEGHQSYWIRTHPNGFL